MHRLGWTLPGRSNPLTRMDRDRVFENNPRLSSTRQQLTVCQTTSGRQTAPPRMVNPPIKGPAQTSNQRVVDDTVRKEGEDYLGEPWATLLWRYPAEFAAAVAAYQGEMEFEVQAKEIANGNRATFTRQNTRYGPGQRPFVEAIFNRDSKLRVLRGGHRAALDSGDAATARSIGIQIGELLDGWVSA